MGLTLCIVDDEREVCDILRLFFESRGHRCHVAHDGQQGLDIVRANKPDAVFLDVAMPRMNGYEVLTALRKDEATKHLPVMMITGVASGATTSAEELARSAGADALLAKPFEFEELIALVHRVTGVSP